MGKFNMIIRNDASSLIFFVLLAGRQMTEDRSLKKNELQSDLYAFKSSYC